MPPLNWHSADSVRLDRLRQVIERAGSVWTLSPEWTSNREIEQRLSEALRAVVDAAGASVDLLAVELMRPLVRVPGMPYEDVVLKFVVGQEGKATPEQDYDSGGYPFLEWRSTSFLRIVISAAPLTSTERAVPQSTLVTSIQSLRRAVALFGTQPDTAISALCRESSFGDDVKPAERAIAAQIAIRGTVHTRKRFDVGLEPPPQRSLLFVPVAIAGSPFGGVAYYSEAPLGDDTTLLLVLATQLITYRIRTLDDAVAAALLARERARWDASVMFVHRLAHDVRKPVALAMDLVGRMTAAYSSDLPPPAREELARLRSLMADLNDVIATRTGVTPDQLRAQAREDAQYDHIKELVDDATWLWRDRAKATGKTVAIHVAPPDLAARVPRHLITEVLSNLVSNAVRAARQEVRVSAHRSPDRDTIQITVSDDGYGIPQSIVTELESEAAPVPSAPTGLGLHIVKFIVSQLLDGTMRFQTGPSGTSVTVEISEVSDRAGVFE